jgi:hypothetical protein
MENKEPINITFGRRMFCVAIYRFGNYYTDNHRRRKMNLIILLSMPLVLMIIVTIYAVVTNRTR